MKTYFLFFLACLPLMAEAQLITTVAGNGNYGNTGNGGLAINAEIDIAIDIAIGKDGTLYFKDAAQVVRKVNLQTGIITACAGMGGSGTAGDGGPAVNAEMLYYDPGLALDSAGNLLIADENRTRKVEAATGIITTIAGTTMPGFSGDGGPATAALFRQIRGIATDDSGNIYVSDRGNLRIRKISSSGLVSTIAGDGSHGTGGDNGPAVGAQFSLYGMSYICLDKEKAMLYITDSTKIRKVDLGTGVITTFAGTGAIGYNGDAIPATAAQLNYPHGMALDALGRLFFVDRYSQRVRMIDTSGIIHTVAGDGTQGYNGDNIPAMQAKIFNAKGLALDSCGNMYFGDGGTNHRLRKVSFNPNCFPLGINESVPSTFTISPNPATSQLTITSTGKLQNISIVNAIGQEVLRQTPGLQKAVLDVSTISAGLYFVRVVDEQGSGRTEKLVIR